MAPRQCWPAGEENLRNPSELPQAFSDVADEHRLAIGWSSCCSTLNPEEPRREVTCRMHPGAGRQHLVVPQSSPAPRPNEDRRQRGGVDRVTTGSLSARVW